VDVHPAETVTADRAFECQRDLNLAQETGSRAFHRDSAAETMLAILREEPPDLSATNKSVRRDGSA
jgi:hypothetical protein